jgi:hypothetical protein
MWFEHWGTTPAERAEVAATEALAGKRLLATQAVTIDAPVERVWPWLVQLGQGRGGFYSYTWLENLVGCHMRNVNRILPELQWLAVGDKVQLHPKAPPLTVTSLEPMRRLALEGWVLSVSADDDGGTRLVSRTYDWRDPSRPSTWRDRILSGRLFLFAHWVMEHRMFAAIKHLAEGSADLPDIVFHAIMVWLALFAAAFANGAFRELCLAHIVTEPWAHHLSVLTAMALFAAIAWGGRAWLRVRSIPGALAIGGLWMALTVVAEALVVERWVARASWSQIRAAYDIAGGSSWPLLVLWIAALPCFVILAAAKTRRLSVEEAR